MAADLSILLKWIVDKASTQEAKKSAEDVAKSIEKTDDAVKSSGAAFDELGADFQKFTGQYKQGTKQNQQATETFAQAVDRTAKQIKTDFSAIETQFDRQIKSIRESRAEWGQLRKVASIGEQFGRGAMVAGTAIIAPLLLAAQNYMSTTEENTRLTREWQAATDSIKESYGRVGKVAAQEILPFLQTASRIMEDVADFAESHPEAISAGLKIGATLIGLGIIATAVSKGIRLVADIDYISTTAQLSIAMATYKVITDEFVAGVYAYASAQEKAVLDAAFAKAGLGTAPAAQSTLSLASAATLIVAGIIGSAVAVSLVNQLLEATGINRKIEEARDVARDRGNRVYPGLINDPKERNLQVELNRAIASKNAAEIERLSKAMDELVAKNRAARNSTDDLSDSLGRLLGSEHEAEIVKAYMAMLEEEKAATKKLANDIADAITDANRRFLEAAGRNASAINAINKRATDNEIKFLLDYHEAYKKAEADYYAERAEIIRDGGIDIERIEEDSQKRLQRLSRDHDESMYNLAAARDALGLRQEQRNYERKTQEEIEDTNDEIARRRQDLAIRLRDMAVAFKAEQAQRKADLEAKLKENEEQKKADLEAQRKAYADERKQIVQQRDQKIRELRDEFNVETQHRREAFINQVRQLDAALLGEQRIRQQFYANALRDAQKFFDDYRRKLPSGGSITTGGAVPVHDFTGYASSGYWYMAKSGKPEFVLSGDDTEIARRALGGQLSRNLIMNAITNNRPALTYVDQRQFAAEVSVETRRAIQRDTIETVQALLDGKAA